MQNLAQGKGKWKEKISEKRKRTLEMLERIKESDAMKIAVIQELIPLGLKAVQDALQEEVEALAGRRYEHGKENRRWGKQWGSIYLRDQKIPVRVPRVRNKKKGEEVRLQRYQKLQEPYRGDHQTFLKLLNGLSTHRYKESAELVPEVFGLSASSVSRRFTKKAETYLELLEERELGDYDFVAIFIDGKRYAEEGIMIALGITIEGKKIVLGIEQMSTENHRALIQFFDKLIERGLKYAEEMLFVIDGSKGLAKAIRQRLGRSVMIQRCHWHKRENIVSYLSLNEQKRYRVKLRNAYNEPTYEGAKKALLQIGEELESINPSAAKSLGEGLEETLTLHQLGLCRELGVSFSTTNCIESIMSQLGQYTDKVDYWRNGTHIVRWVAAGLLHLEPRLRKVKGFRYLKMLRLRIQEKIEKQRYSSMQVLEKQKVAVT